MNLETKKIKSPFKPDAKYLSELASRVQSKVGIDNKEIFKQDKSVKIPSKRKESLQLTVEFGFPLKSEKNQKYDRSEISTEEHIEVVIEDITPVGDICVVQAEVEKKPQIHSDFPFMGISLRRVDLPNKHLIIESKGIDEVIESSQLRTNQEEVSIEEIEYDSNELDLLHEQMEKSLLRVAQTREVQNEEVLTDIKSSSITEDNSEGPSWSIPWASIFGIAASIVAVAAAWFVWNIIKKPMAIDDWADQNVVKTNKVQINVVPAANSTDKETVEEFEAPSLDTDLGLVYDLVVEEDIPLHRNINFQELSEQGKVSSVELEKEGLLVLELEDDIFDEVVLEP